jgi:hypothetical protein
LKKLAEEHDRDVSIHLLGQELQPETYAICKADLLLKGESQAAENMKYGSALSSDAFPSMEFDFILSNPPYGKSWKVDLGRTGGKKDISDSRFLVQHEGEEPRLITRSSDGQLMFLVNKPAKMNVIAAKEHVGQLMGHHGLGVPPGQFPVAGVRGGPGERSSVPHERDGAGGWQVQDYKGGRRHPRRHTHALQCVYQFLRRYAG